MIQRIAVIDVGSNTIVLAVYSVQSGKLHLEESISRPVHLVGFIENGRMMPEGLDAAFRTVHEYMEFLSLRRIDDVHADITECGRGIRNADRLVDTIRRAGCTDVRILTGEEEAMCDFYGAMQDSSQESGLLIDIGGGSTEFVSFENKRVLAACSVPMGCVRLAKRKYSPSVSEPYIADIRKRFPKLSNASHAVGVGGTLRYTTYVLQELYPVGNSFNCDQVRDLYSRLLNDEPEAVHALQKRVDPDRAAVLLPGMGMLMAAIDSFGIEIIHKSENGVREGYLAHFILRII